jgi:hypothetical protein
MSTNFSISCRVCNGEVDSFSQNVRFILVEDFAVQEQEVILTSCGCTIDFPEWQIDLKTGLCQIYNFAGTLYLEFTDLDMTLEEE